MTDILFPPFLTIALTGTPGTGKTEVSKKMETEGYRVLHITEFIQEFNIPSEWDEERDCAIVDMDALEEAVFEYQAQIRRDFNQMFFSKNLTFKNLHDSPEYLPILLIESHLAHYLCDLSVVLRTHPDMLKQRLSKRGYSEKKVMENILAESIDVVLCDCFDYCRRVYEINTTDMDIDKTCVCLKELIHTLYDDEFNVYDSLMKKMDAFSKDFTAKQAIATGLPMSDVLDAYGFEDDGAVVYGNDDEIGDYVEEENLILAKYAPGKNDWSETTD